MTVYLPASPRINSRMARIWLHPVRSSARRGSAAAPWIRLSARPILSQCPRQAGRIIRSKNDSRLQLRGIISSRPGRRARGTPFSRARNDVLAHAYSASAEHFPAGSRSAGGFPLRSPKARLLADHPAAGGVVAAQKCAAWWICRALLGAEDGGGSGRGRHATNVIHGGDAQANLPSC